MDPKLIAVVRATILQRIAFEEALREVPEMEQLRQRDIVAFFGVVERLWQAARPPLPEDETKVHARKLMQGQHEKARRARGPALEADEKLQ